MFDLLPKVGAEGDPAIGFCERWRRELGFEREWISPGDRASFGLRDNVSEMLG